MIKASESIQTLFYACTNSMGLLSISRDELIIELLADDPGVLEDLPAWCKETGHRFLALKKNQEGIFVAYVQKQKKPVKELGRIAQEKGVIFHIDAVAGVGLVPIDLEEMNVDL